MIGTIKDRRRRGLQRIRQHHRLDGHEFQQAPAVGFRQGSLACYSPWGDKELDTTEQLNCLKINLGERKTNGFSHIHMVLGI